MGNAGVGAISGSGFAFKLEGDGDAKIGNTTNDLLQVTGAMHLNDNVFFLANGRLGIGTDAPDYKLDVAGNIGVNEHLYHNGDGDTRVSFPSANQINLVAGGKSVFKFASNTITLNNGNNDIDTKIMADNGQEVVFVNAGNNRVGIGTTSPGVDLDVDGTVNATTYQIGGTAINSTAAELNLLDASVTSEASDGAWAIVERIAKATVDSNDYARSAGPVSLGVTIPDNAILTKYVFDCTQTFAAGDDGSEVMAVVDLGLYNASGKVFDFAAQANIERTGASSAPYVAGTSQVFPLASANSKLTEALTAKIHVFDDGSGMLNSLDAGALDIYIYYIIGA